MVRVTLNLLQVKAARRGAWEGMLTGSYRFGFACLCIRWTIRREVSRKRSAQLEMQSDSQEDSLLPGLEPMHLSQQVLVSLEMICCTAAFWFSSWMKACMAAAARGSVSSMVGERIAGGDGIEQEVRERSVW